MIELRKFIRKNKALKKAYVKINSWFLRKQYAKKGEATQIFT